jgi:hypothetical protein
MRIPFSHIAGVEFVFVSNQSSKTVKYDGEEAVCMSKEGVCVCWSVCPGSRRVYTNDRLYNMVSCKFSLFIQQYSCAALLVTPAAWT